MFKAANKGVTDTRLDHAFFVLGGVAAAWLAFLLVGESFQLGWGQVWFYVVFWRSSPICCSHGSTGS